MIVVMRRRLGCERSTVVAQPVLVTSEDRDGGSLGDEPFGDRRARCRSRRR